jgi:hypothetical protein
MSDAHGAAYNHSPEVNKQSGDLNWMTPEDWGGYGGPGLPMESHNDGDNDTDDIGTYGSIPRPVENQAFGQTNGFLTPGQRGYDSGGGWN